MAGRTARDMTQGPVFSHILRLLTPMSFGILAMMLVGIVDAYWVGILGTSEQAAVQMAFPVGMLAMSLAIGLGAGAVSVVSRAVGARDPGHVRRVATDALMLATLVVILMTTLGIALVEPLFRAMGASDAVMPHVRNYMTLWFAGSVFIVVPMIASNLLRALGAALLPSLIMIGAAVLNMALDPLLIFGLGPVPAMGVTGAALATLLSQAMAASVFLWWLVAKENLIDRTWPGIREVIANWGEIARIGALATLANMMNPAAMAVAVAAAARFGDAAVAGFGVAARMEAFAIVPLFALSASIGPVTGQNGGAGETARVKRAFATSFGFCLAWGLAIAVILFLAAGPLSAAFLPSEAARDMAQEYWRLVPLTVAGYGISMAAAAGFNGLGRPLYGVAMTFGRCIILLAPLAWIGGNVAGASGVIRGIAAANAISGVLIAWYVLSHGPMIARRGRRRTPPPAAPATPIPAETAPAAAPVRPSASE